MSDAGRFAGHVVIGEVVDANSPYQDGAVRVKWRVGSAVQDELATGDLPWTRVMFPSTNPSVSRMGGPHTGLRVGSKVYGFPADGAGQDFVIMGTMVSSGNGAPDDAQTPDSDIPTGAKVQQTDDVRQPHYGDKNDVATDASGGVIKRSIVDFARDEGGPDKKPAKYPDPTDSVGNEPPLTA